MLKRWHFLMLKDTCHLSLQDSISWRPLWSLHSSSTTSTMLYNKQSSPKRRIFENMMLLAISPIYMRGPKKVPCATADLTFTGAEATLLQNALRAFSKPSPYLLTQTSPNLPLSHTALALREGVGGAQCQRPCKNWSIIGTSTWWPLIIPPLRDFFKKSNQLRIAWSTFPKTMLKINQDVIGLTVLHNMSEDSMFKDFTADRSKWHWSVICRI